MITTTDKTRLGANYNEETKSVDFKLFSKNATDVILCIFEEAKNQDSVMNFDMVKNQETDVWETSIKSYALHNLKKPVYYGYRLFGPNWVKEENFEIGSNIGFRAIVDCEGNRFNPNKIAYDPFAKELSHLPSSVDVAMVNEDNYTTDNAKTAVKSVFFPIENVEIPTVRNKRAFKDEIIGEVHIKDLTELSDFVEKGTYLGALKVAKGLKNMGFTTIEFLPLNEFDDNNNHWGYMPLSYFALSKKYAYKKEPMSALVEFRELIKAFHEEGLKVCMDVVYNHTGEARTYHSNVNCANLMSYALIDNKTYYKLMPDNYYVSNSFCCNDFNVANKPVQELILDSVEFFARQGVDAFRFDLAAALLDTNPCGTANYDKYQSFATEMSKELEKRGIKVNNINEMGEGINLIAEPWTCSGANAYQLGNFPKNWAEWNDIARNTIRANTIRRETTDPLGLRNLIEGTPFLFGDTSRSINYIASHDGFTLNDLNSYDRKNPLTNGGGDWEMCSSYENNHNAQENAIRKQILLLMLSKGIVMLQVGDIVAHSKGGNNNSYDKDDATNYLDFSDANNLQTRSGRVFDFVVSAIEFRKNHSILTDENYDKKLQYFNSKGELIDKNDNSFWQNVNESFLCARTISEVSVCFGISKDFNPIQFKLPELKDKNRYLIVDTSRQEPVNLKGEPYLKENYTISPNSVVLFVEK